MIILFFTLLGSFFILLMVGMLRTFQIQHDTRQQKFLAGFVPKQLPDGFYQGSADGYHGSWQGKKFNRTEKTGINILSASGLKKEKFPFIFYPGQGIVDRVQVVKIDYNIAVNPWWLRMILDEIVAVTKDHYLGKVYLQLPLGIVFSLGYFSLEPV